jgi:hypothetical protein
MNFVKSFSSSVDPRTLFQITEKFRISIKFLGCENDTHNRNKFIFEYNNTVPAA